MQRISPPLFTESQNPQNRLGSDYCTHNIFNVPSTYLYLSFETQEKYFRAAFGPSGVMSQIFPGIIQLSVANWIFCPGD